MLNIFPFGKKKEENVTNTVENVEMSQQVTEPVVQETTQAAPVEVAPTASIQNDAVAPVQSEMVQPVAPAPVNDDPNRKKVLLVVDDNKLNLKVASKLLSDMGCDIETVQSGKECIEKVQESNKYDLIFMDIMMPDMNGVQTMHTLKSMPGFHAPVVSLTADAVEGSREKYLGEGFDDYIPKPMDRNEMHDAITKYINI